MFLAVFSVAVAVGSGLAAWLSAGRIVILPTLIGAVGLGVFAHRSRLGHLRHAAGARAGRRRRGVRIEPRPAGDDRSRRPRHLRRPLHRADLRRGAGLGRRRPARPRHRRRQRAQRRLHGRRHHRHRGAAGVPRLDAGAVHADRARDARRRRRDRPDHAGQRRCMDFLSILFRVLYRVELRGVENLDNAGHNPIIALNHTSFLDAALALSLLPKDPVFAIDSAHGAALVGEAVPALHPRHAARSDQADGDAHADQRGESRRAADHLPGGPHHRHRQPDEDLRRRRPDRRQDRRLRRAGAARRARRHAVHAAASRPDSPPLVPQGHRDRAGAGASSPSIRRSRASTAARRRARRSTRSCRTSSTAPRRSNARCPRR